jgi:hypothetical protein
MAKLHGRTQRREPTRKAKSTIRTVARGAGAEARTRRAVRAHALPLSRGGGGPCYLSHVIATSIEQIRRWARTACPLSGLYGRVRDLSRPYGRVRDLSCPYGRVRDLSLAIVVVLTGCGRDEDPPHLVRKTIGTDGGLISSHDGVLTIVLQAGALTEATEIEVFPSDEPPRVFGPAYRVRPNVPLEIDAEVTYRRVLPEDPKDTDIAAIRLEDYENENGWWRPLPRLEVDAEHDLVLSLDSELSLYYALLEDSNGPDGNDETDTGGESSSDDSPVTDDSASDTAESTGPVILSHAADIQPIWDAHCLGPGCHEPPSPGNGLVLSEDAYAHIVGVPAFGANRPFIDPGDPDHSYIVNKIEGEQLDPDVNGTGSPMPLAMDPLSDEQVELIRLWIEQGALE